MPDPNEVDFILVMRDDFDHALLVFDGTITGVGRVAARGREAPVFNLDRLVLATS